MTSRERALAAFALVEPDLVPRWYGASPEFLAKARPQLRLPDDERFEEVQRAGNHGRRPPCWLPGAVAGSQIKATGAKLVFCHDYALAKRRHPLSPTRKFDSVEKRNKIAVTLMQELGVAIDDLYAVALPAMAKVGRKNDVHFSPEGYALLAKAVAQSIETALKK